MIAEKTTTAPELEALQKKAITRKGARMWRLGVRAALCLLTFLGPSSARVLAGELKRDLPSPETIVAEQDLEPSGIASADSQTLYVVSDNAKIMKVVLKNKEDGSVTVSLKDVIFNGNKSDKNLDFESVAFVPRRPGFLYVGIEGRRENGTDIKPSIREFNLSNKQFTQKRWELADLAYDDKNGMESMTFVPDEKAPNAFGGYFLAATQMDTMGEIQGYNLKLNAPGSINKSFAFNVGQCKTSDLYYFPPLSVLYVTYDEPCSGIPGRAVWEYRRMDSGEKASYVRIAQTPLGEAGKGLEAVTAIQRDRDPETVNLFLGFDPNAAGSRVALYQPYGESPICGGKSTTCKDIADTSCGWCQSSGNAVLGSEQGQAEEWCQNWIWKNSNCNKCEGVEACEDIEGKDCVWCVEPVQQAMPEASDGSPVYKAGCTKWIQKSSNCKKK